MSGGNQSVNRLYRAEQSRKEKHGCVAGVDEAGRGPMAGPVVAAAVILPEGLEIPGVDDSKKLTSQKREGLFEIITGECTCYGVGIRSARYIDAVGIAKATYSAMRIAVSMLTLKGHTPDLVIVDGYAIPGLCVEQEALVRADSQIASVACASIVAKVVRDRIMIRYEGLYPGYEFARHKGYCTQAHVRLLNERGPSPIHRRSFAPVASLSVLEVVNREN